MSISQKIVAAQEELSGLKDQLTEQAKSFDETAEESAGIAMEEVSESIEKKTQNLNVLLKAEAALGAQAQPVAPAIVHAESLGRKGQGDADLLVASAAATMEAYIKRVPVSQILEERYGDDDRVKAVAGVVNKAAQPIATTTGTGWAAELTRESFAQFMELIQPESVVPRLPLDRYDFGQSSSIKFSRREATPALPNLAGAFRAEGDPIRIGAASLGSGTLTPKSMGVIGTFTNELFQRSTPNIAAEIRKWMIEDTAIALDGAFLGTTIGSATVPSGIQAGIAAGDTHASAGNTHANITAAIRAAMQSMSGQNLGRRPVFVMHPSRAWGIQLALTATGGAAFPSMANGTLLGAPVVTSTTVPADVVFMIDGSEVAFAGGTPSFLGTEVATLHEEALQSDVLPIATGSAGAGVVATPARSLFQTNSSALRMTIELDWSIKRSGAVQLITGVNW